MISSRGRNALRVLVDLARQDPESFVPLKDISARQEISQKYSESIMAALSKGGLVEGIHGKGGGYRLSRKPEDCSLGEVLRITEGSLAPVACLETGSTRCAHPCPTLPVWEKLEKLVTDYLDSVSLADIM
ncbi:MAG: Rrf2 family transcriptional regulator [Clostridia bacterium]|nr:Rrf2 family transcriptional regulator [Clostridia bacterium]